MALGALAGYVAAVGLIRYRFGSFGFESDIRFSFNRSCRASLPLFGCVLFWILYDSQDVILLNYFSFPQREIGLFSAAMKIVDVLRVYPVLMMGVFFPVLSRLHRSDPDAFRRKQQRLFIFMRWSLLAVASCRLCRCALAIIRLLYKERFYAGRLII